MICDMEYTSIYESGLRDNFDSDYQYIKGYPLTNDTDKTFFKDNAEKFYNFLNDSYMYQLNTTFGGFSSVKHMVKKCSMFIAAYKDDTLIALTVHNSYRGGYKCVGMTAYLQKNDDVLHRDGVLALYEIIKDGIDYYTDWVWAEASDGPEYMYQKMGGCMLPVEIAEAVMKNPKDFKPEDDGFHYTRRTEMRDLNGQLVNGGYITKVMFGFNSQETYNEYVKWCNSLPKKSLDESKLNEAVIYKGESLLDIEVLRLSRLLGFVNIYRDEYTTLTLKILLRQQVDRVYRFYNPDNRDIKLTKHMMIQNFIDEAKFVINNMDVYPKAKNLVQSLKEVGVI